MEHLVWISWRHIVEKWGEKRFPSHLSHGLQWAYFRFPSRHGGKEKLLEEASDSIRQLLGHEKARSVNPGKQRHRQSVSSSFARAGARARVCVCCVQRAQEIGPFVSCCFRGFSLLSYRFRWNIIIRTIRITFRPPCSPPCCVDLETSIFQTHTHQQTIARAQNLIVFRSAAIAIRSLARPSPRLMLPFVRWFR